jgi:hypothetical protein
MQFAKVKRLIPQQQFENVKLNYQTNQPIVYGL